MSYIREAHANTMLIQLRNKIAPEGYKFVSNSRYTEESKKYFSEQYGDYKVLDIAYDIEGKVLDGWKSIYVRKK